MTQPRGTRPPTVSAESGPLGLPIAIRETTIRFGSFTAVERASLHIDAGEFVCLVGPSGCGKSTLLNAVAGFVETAAGEIVVGDERVSRPDVSRGVVFQSSEALFPWLKVRQNVAFGPRMRRLDRARVRELTDRYLRLVGLAHAAGRYPRELSGGMRQRVQLARVLANEPAVVLMDEPFGALDAQTREVMQRELERIWQETRTTVLFITHDLTEAITLGDRIVTMTAGPPGQIKNVYPVDLPRPRDATDAESLGLRRVLRDDITAEVSKTLRAEGLDEGG